MAFCDFAFPEVQERLGVRVEDADHFCSMPPMAVREDFAAFLRDGAGAGR